MRLLVAQGQCPGGLLSLRWVPCAVSGHNAVFFVIYFLLYFSNNAALYWGLGEDQSIAGCTADSINNPRSACTTLRAPGPGTQADCVYAVGADLSVGSRASQLLCSLLAGLSHACLVSLTPFVLRHDMVWHQLERALL